MTGISAWALGGSGWRIAWELPWRLVPCRHPGFTSGAMGNEKKRMGMEKGALYNTSF